MKKKALYYIGRKYLRMRIPGSWARIIEKAGMAWSLYRRMKDE